MTTNFPPFDPADLAASRVELDIVLLYSVDADGTHRIRSKSFYRYHLDPRLPESTTDDTGNITYTEDDTRHRLDKVASSIEDDIQRNLNGQHSEEHELAASVARTAGDKALSRGFNRFGMQWSVGSVSVGTVLCSIVLFPTADTKGDRVCYVKSRLAISPDYHGPDEERIYATQLDDAEKELDTSLAAAIATKIASSSGGLTADESTEGLNPERGPWPL
ncbi:uncharacterized protein MKK02DRAFT_42738 [Dioszegia hungarica]|uniref:Uncharacterized protein n=1 Tax=Dioszegia hungarica TaxID=4972 RepID=A0AA38HFT5_9TREE|nr:uncharacterized protein MKK02DRAFT_42738 [Dioszegia hungarica]KAI9638351.1 hypothetical protein MKK02DRAFT_42738 [Dioszegia hungarica]